MPKFKYTAIRAKQANGKFIFSFPAFPGEILKFSSIEGVKRHENGQLDGFQRHQIAPHIKEIRRYLERSDAILPNAIIVAFLDGVDIHERPDGLLDITINADENRIPGLIVDGQQRITALSGSTRSDFQVFVSCILCKDYNELRQQFILINNSKPLPKPLIYELLPNVDGLPEKFSSRSFAARMVEKLNYTKTDDPVFYGRIRQHTNSNGKLSDLAIQKIVMESATNGAIRTFIEQHPSTLEPDSITAIEENSFELIHTFFSAVKEVFPEAWNDMSPKTSRLVHGAGLVSMGFIMELLYVSFGVISKEKFVQGLKLLKPKTAWTQGKWKFSEDDQRPWNAIQNTTSDIDLLTNYLIRNLRNAMKSLPEKVAKL
jgi:DGQHR domain-containing protein